MMRRLCALAMALAVAATGCSDSGDSGGSGGDLKFANWQWLEPGGRGDAIWSAVNGWRDPSGKLVKQAIPRKDYESTLQTQMGQGRGPDILVLPDTSFERFRKAGLLAPLDDVRPAGTALNRSNALTEVDGRRWAYTWEIVQYALFWNEDLLKKAGVRPPTDPAGLVAAATAIKKRTGNPGFAVRHQLNEETPWWIDFSNWPYGFGGAWARNGALTINDPNNVQALRTFKQLYDSGAMPVGDDASTFRKRFADGRLGMMIDNSSALSTMVNGNKIVPGSKVGAGPLPFGTPGSSHVGVHLALNKKSKRLAAARKWLTWWLGPDGQRAAAAALGASTIATDTPPPASFTTGNPWTAAFKKQAPASVSAVVPGFEAKTPQIAHVVLGQVESVLTKGTDPKAALDRAQREAQELAR
ncbi:ABC transporter substrate-binding protein [Spirillospora sp. CA-294931]|uniref:ABC transporter substrate-binding protein n=1 Tax=Spirillospora sp. CA-294931 TaxID=3240042 RepID=UPI003D91B127